MKQGTFEPCKEHEGHFGGCLWCENERLRERAKMLEADLDRMTSLSWQFEKNVPNKIWSEIVDKWCK